MDLLKVDYDKCIKFEDIFVSEKLADLAKSIDIDILVLATCPVSE